MNKLISRSFSSFGSYRRIGYGVEEVGRKGGDTYRCYLKKDGELISSFHDIPLILSKSNGIYNMVVEIPFGETCKYEVNKKDFLNPIRQDIKDGVLRNVSLKYPFNYGCFPQTFESPDLIDPHTKCPGDADPIDVCEISSSHFNVGDVFPVKILGTFAMIDGGETDWKVLSISTSDPLSHKLNDISDVQKYLPDKLEQVFTFLRDYKIPDGKPPNTFAFNNKPRGKSFARDVVSDGFHQWKKLFKDPPPGISTVAMSQPLGVPLKSYPKLLGQKESQEMDEDLMGSSICYSLEQLMELAGLSVASAITRVYPPTHFSNVLVLCGPGNNGGDGLVAARHLKSFGYNPRVWFPSLLGKDRTGHVQFALRRQCEFGFPVDRSFDLSFRSDSRAFDLVIDAVFGFGFDASNIRPPFDQALKFLKKVSLPIVSVDVPTGWPVSGFESDKQAENYINPDMLISLSAPKRCSKFFRGPHHFLGGRFVPRSIREEYGLQLPVYPSDHCCLRLPERREKNK